MSYFRMRKKIKKIESETNNINYEEKLFNEKPWTFEYLGRLYEASTNGARSPRALKHLKKVCNTLYGIRAAVIICATIAAVIFAVMLGKNKGVIKN